MHTPGAWLSMVNALRQRFGECALLRADDGRTDRPATSAPVSVSSAARDQFELRDYGPGDDPRQIDWALCARRDELLVRVRALPVDRRVAILLDCSGSMMLGHPAKFELASHLAAALAAASLAGGMRCQLAGFARGVIGATPALYGREQLGLGLKFLAALSPRRQPTDSAASLAGYSRACSRRSVVVVLSDLDDWEGFTRGAGELLDAGHQLRAVQIFDPREAQPGVCGEVELVDVESGRSQRVVVTERIVRRYAELYARRQESIRAWCRRCGVSVLRFAAGTDRRAAVEQLFRPLGHALVQSRPVAQQPPCQA